MTLTDEVMVNNRYVAKELRKAGITVRPYARSPLSGSQSLFTLSLDDANVLRLWAGMAEVSVLPSRDRSIKQAVVQVREKGRRIRKELKIDPHRWTEIGSRGLAQAQIQYSEYWMRNNLGVTMPQGTEYSVVAYNPTTKKVADPWAYGVDLGTVTIQGRVPTTNQTFLVGKDEKSQFVAMLPRKAKSVKDAHESLRPAGVPRTAKRQGEWFFVPATAEEKKAVNAAVNNRGIEYTTSRYGGRRGRGYGDRVVQPGALESGSSHHAPCSIRVNGKMYAAGVVYDNRPNRHGSLFLNDWHRVIRNRERVNSALQGRQRARWD